GTSKLFGFSLMKNFSYPYFSRSVAEFWRRWHISLNTWFRDYLYIPLGGSKGNNLLKVRNIFIIFIVSGFWHGANWTFIVWGALNALFILPSILMKTNRNNINHIESNRLLLPSFREFIGIIFTFGLIVFSWIFFRSETITDAIQYIQRMITTYNIGIGYPYKLMKQDVSLIFFISVMLIFEWCMRTKDHPFQFSGMKISRPIRWGIYIIFSLLILWFSGQQAEFIYFQF
ncbi:MAG: MBOAT family O-acyltransferase, partial [Bergeyella zoohelcum]|nr:MBOAT family O-acyltransferase [Bergeyella zoohelcum]